jgi:hypothetical protein
VLGIGSRVGGYERKLSFLLRGEIDDHALNVEAVPACVNQAEGIAEYDASWAIQASVPRGECRREAG